MKRAFAAAAVSFLILTATVALAQSDLEAVFQKPPKAEGGLGVPVGEGVAVQAVGLPLDPLPAILPADGALTYQAGAATTSQELRATLIQCAALGRPCSIAASLADADQGIMDQPYWPQAKGLETVRARLAAMVARGTRAPKVAVLVPWLNSGTVPEDVSALRDIANYLMSVQVTFALLDETGLAASVTQAGELTVEGQKVRAVMLPPVTLNEKATTELLGKLLETGCKVIAVRALPKAEGDLQEPVAAWAQSSFNVKSEADVKDPIVQHGNTVFIPWELERLTPILNSVKAEDLFLYPPSRQVVGSHTIGQGDPSVDWYLLHNTSRNACHTYVTIYKECEPEVWDLDTGRMGVAPGYHVTAEGTTILPLVLQPEDAVFLMCRRPPPPAGADHHIAQAPGLEYVQASEQNGKVVVRGLARLNGTHTVMLADGRKGKAEVRDLPPHLIVEGGWGFRLASNFDRQPSEISQARVRAVQGEEDTSGWSAPDLDDADWDLIAIGDPLPSLAAKWHAKWLTYQGDGEVRYFRKRFDLPGAVKQATVTVTADNVYELYVNGEQIGKDGDWYTAETYDVAGRLKPGANAIAIRVDNQGSVAGMLCEAHITLENGDLVRVATDGSWRMTKEPGEGWQAVDFDDAGWGDPEVGGSPPAASPWGDVPGLPPEPGGGREIWYRFDLPPGAAVLRLPEGVQVLHFWVDGEELRVAGRLPALRGAQGAGAQKAVLAIRGPDPLQPPLLCDSDPSRILVGSWATQGLRGYAGEATYERVLELPQEYAQERLFLDLGEVGVAARVRVNGKDLGSKCRPPFVFDLGGHARKGKLRLEITVANTLANANAEPEADGPASGILGPVQILPFREVEVVVE
jgi:hypothetical protein